ncbi:MAG: tRNA (cytidine(34)-2'-O)-methyltransferase [Gammaproteobacteria bacterium]|nr:tRNA (cytidine(34)-2'-O)-methyltransferase [Gammaproteobacteria bacterium]
MFRIVLVEPEIPPNTGNIIRLSANCGAILHLIKPLGFDLSDKKLRRAGLDYHDLAHMTLHNSLEDFFASAKPGRVFACSTKGTTIYSEVSYHGGDTFIFGPESRGLPISFLQSLPEGSVIRIPMLEGSRSLNLSNAAAIIIYEAWRQNDFKKA